MTTVFRQFLTVILLCFVWHDAPWSVALALTLLFIVAELRAFKMRLKKRADELEAKLAATTRQWTCQNPNCPVGCPDSHAMPFSA